MLDELEHELERVRGYRADVSDPDGAALAEARARLMEAISSEPMPAGAPAKARLMGKPPQRRQRRRRLALAGALSTAGVAVAGVLGLTTAATPVSALAAQLNHLATVAASQDWTGIPGPGQYLYTESQGLDEADTMNDGQECTIQYVDHRQSWIATDGSGAINEGGSNGQFTSSADAATCAAMKVTATATDRSGGTRFGAGGLSFLTNDWRAFSTDPATLLKQVHLHDGGPDTPSEWFVNVADFMRESDVPPAIRSALYRAAALIPGVKLLGTQTDPTGQTGLAVGYPYPNGQIHSELIFDQQTGRLLAEQYFDQSGKLVEWTAYTSQKIVNSVPDYPLEQPGPSSTSANGATPQQGQSTITSAGGTSSTPAQANSATTDTTSTSTATATDT